MNAPLKKSKQRDAIVKYLQSTKDHPTADTVYLHIRKIFPNVSLGTVYRNLSLLSDRGDILKLSCDGKADRYDANTDQHYHFICKECGDVIDLEMESLDHIETIAGAHFKGKILSHVAYFYGICEECLSKETKN